VYTLVGLQVIDIAGARVLDFQRVNAWNSWDDQLPAWTPTFADLSPEAQLSVRRQLETQLLERVQAAAAVLKL
jgi:hypothetical protein